MTAVGGAARSGVLLVQGAPSVQAVRPVRGAPSARMISARIPGPSGVVRRRRLRDPPRATPRARCPAAARTTPAPRPTTSSSGHAHGGAPRSTPCGGTGPKPAPAVLGVFVPDTLPLCGPRQGRGHLGGGPVQRAAQLRDVLPRVRGPCESRRREKQEIEGQPHARGRVARPGPAIRIGLPRAWDQGDPGAAAPPHTASVQHHEHDPAHGHDTQPRGREFAVEPPGLTHQQVPAQPVDRGAQRQSAVFAAGP